MTIETTDSHTAVDTAIAIYRELMSVDPLSLTAAIVEQMRAQSDLTDVEADIAQAAVLMTYNAIIGGVSLVASTT